jgi:hypothetical protein
VDDGDDDWGDDCGQILKSRLADVAVKFDIILYSIVCKLDRSINMLCTQSSIHPSHPSVGHYLYLFYSHHQPGQATPDAMLS